MTTKETNAPTAGGFAAICGSVFVTTYLTTTTLGACGNSGDKRPKEHHSCSGNRQKALFPNAKMLT